MFTQDVFSVLLFPLQLLIRFWSFDIFRLFWLVAFWIFILGLVHRILHLGD